MFRLLNKDYWENEQVSIILSELFLFFIDFIAPPGETGPL